MPMRTACSCLPRVAAAVSASAGLLLASACGAPVFSGSGPFARAVFVGDSLTAGYQNGSLLDKQQVNGYANLVAQQADFSTTLPLIAAPGLPGVLQLQSLTPIPVITQTPGISTGRDNYFARATDLAVPGHMLHDVIYREPTLSPASEEDVITDLVLGLPADASTPATQVAQAVGFAPTTVFVWAGANDALVADDAGDASVMTPVPQFAADYATMIGALSKTGAKLVVANVPDVTKLPYMTPVPVLANEVQSVTGIPAVLVEYLLGLSTTDLLNPTGLSDVEAEVAGLATGGSLKPLPASDVLTYAEQQQVQATTAAYNQVIAADVAAAKGVLVDINSFFTQIGQGVTVNGYTATNGFLNGLFGLDGVHPTNTGYALVANQFIQATNAAWGLGTPLVDVSKVAAADPYFPPNLKPGGAQARAAARRSVAGGTHITPTAGASVRRMLRGGQLAAPDVLKQVVTAAESR